MPQVAAAEEVGWCQSIAHSPVSSKEFAPEVESVVPATAVTVSAISLQSETQLLSARI